MVEKYDGDISPLCCRAGISSGNNESAGKKKSVRISRADVYPKPALVQVSHAAVKDKQHPYYTLKYERIAKHRGKKRAIIAIVRMILTAICSMFSTGEIWNPVDMPEHLRERQCTNAAKHAIHFLESQRIIVSELLPSSAHFLRNFSAFRGWLMVSSLGAPLICISFTLFPSCKKIFILDIFYPLPST